MNDSQLGIYCITNKHTNKMFINSTKNINTYKAPLIKKLNKGEHKNKRLQDAWNKYKQDSFEFIILETLDDPDKLNERKNYWINQFRSNEIDYGYNLEEIKRPWQQKRDEWSKQKKWHVDGSIQQFLYSIIKQLDYNLEFAEDRVEHLNKVLTNEKIEWLINYISSPLFAKKQIKSKSDFLTENDTSLLGLSTIVDYLVFPKYKNQTQKKKSVEWGSTVKLKKTKKNMNLGSKKEILLGSKEEVEKIPKIFTINKKIKITSEDLVKYPEIKEVYDVLQYLRKVLGHGKNSNIKKECEKAIVTKYGEKQLYMLKKLFKDLSSEIVIMKEKLAGIIHFKRLTKESTVFNFDEDTGYFSDKYVDGQIVYGDYVLVSENRIDFAKEKHILELINYYSQLKQSVYYQPDHDMWAILFVLDELIEKTLFDDYIKDILIMKIDGYEAKDIIEKIYKKYGVKLTEDRLSKIYNDTIPKMIASTYLQDREDWIFTYKVKGTYKTCAKCKQNRLATTKYFSPDKRNKDGLHSFCKNCR